MHLEVRSPFPGFPVVGARITDEDTIKQILNSEYAAYVIRVAAPMTEDK